MWEYRHLYAQLGPIDRPRPAQRNQAPLRPSSVRRVYNPSDKARVRLAAAR